MENEKQNTRVGGLISAKMEEQGVGIRDLAAAVDTTYEHIRRIVKGEGVPSKFVLKLICTKLKIQYKEAERLVTADRIQKKFGNIPLELAGKIPEMEPLERVWPQLTTDQQSDLIGMAQSWAKRNRRENAA